MALERDFITPADVVILTTANVVGNTASTDMFADTTYANTAPSLRLDFAKTRVLDPRIQFFRNSNATFEDQQGIIRTAGPNQPRFNFSNGVCEGLLIEQQATNFWRNESFDYGLSAVSAGTSIGPDGRPAYRYVIPRGAEHSFQGWNQFGGTFTANGVIGSTTDFTFTGYFGPPTGSIPLRADIYLSAANTTQTVYCECIVNGNNGTIEVTYVTPPFTNVVSPTITRHVNGMWKLRWTVRVTADVNQRNLIGSGGQIRSVAGGTFFTGDGVSGIEFCCCQFEQASEPSSYIPTATATATRIADVAVMDGENFAGIYNPQQGTVFVEGREYLNSFNRGVFTISDGTAFNVAYMGYIPTNLIGAEVINNSIFAAQGFGAKTSGASFKLAQTYNGSNTIIVANGTTIQNSINSPTNISKNVDRLIIGDARFTNGYFPASTLNGTIKRLYFYKTPLTLPQHTIITS